MKECLVEYVNYQISNSNDDLVCPIGKCGLLMKTYEIKNLPGVNKE